VARPRWKLTVRNGAEVEHRGFEELGEAVTAMRERAIGIRAGAPARTVYVLRTFKPEDQVRARLQISGRGLLRRPVAGVDVRGDGTFMPFAGGVGRRELDATDRETPFEAVRKTLEAESG